MFGRMEKQAPPASPEPVDVENASLEPPEDPLNSFTLVAVGDIMLGRGVGEKIERLGAEFPFERTAQILREADLTFGNLESPMSSTGVATEGKEVTFRAAPGAIHGIESAGIDVLSIANNHAMDYGPAALMETMDILAHSSIAYVGAGADWTAAHRPACFTINGTKIAFLAYSQQFHLVVEAQHDHPGVAIARSEEIKADIEKANEWADIVIVSFHWGWEYSDHPDAVTRDLAHLSVESGASLVIGHHPHVIQGVEVYKGGLICYSLGNFVFDQRGRRNRRGLVLRCSIDKSGVQRAELLPVIIDFTDFRPSLALVKVAESVLLELERLSEQLDTVLELKGNVAIVLRKEEPAIGT